MNILITGANGFVARNLKLRLKEIKEGKDKARKIRINEIYEFDKDTDPVLLEGYCKNTNFVFHLAGVNRPKKVKNLSEGIKILKVYCWLC